MPPEALPGTQRDKGRQRNARRFSIRIVVGDFRPRIQVEEPTTVRHVPEIVAFDEQKDLRRHVFVYVPADVESLAWRIAVLDDVAKSQHSGVHHANILCVVSHFVEDLDCF